MDDVTAVAQLVLAERFARDRGDWARMAECYAAASRVRVTWFDGSGPEFVTASRAGWERGTRSVHRCSPPVVHVRGDRAVVAMPAAIEARVAVGGVECDMVSFTRILERVERTAEGWRIRSLDCAYERDTLTPVVPGLVPDLDVVALASFRPTYRYLSLVLREVGEGVDQDLAGDDRPDTVQRLTDELDAWLAEG